MTRKRRSVLNPAKISLHATGIDTVGLKKLAGRNLRTRFHTTAESTTVHALEHLEPALTPALIAAIYEAEASFAPDTIFREVSIQAARYTSFRNRDTRLMPKR